MSSVFDIFSLIGGGLLAISLIGLGVFTLRRGTDKHRGALFLLLGVCLAAILAKGILSGY